MEYKDRLADLEAKCSAPSVPEYRKRMEEEIIQLNDRRDRLGSFICEPTFKELPASKRALLKAQAEAMREYADILTARIILEQN